jgi:hypothetical protein
LAGAGLPLGRHAHPGRSAWERIVAANLRTCCGVSQMKRAETRRDVPPATLTLDPDKL